MRSIKHNNDKEFVGQLSDYLIFNDSALELGYFYISLGLMVAKEFASGEG
jgi:hypothetical protein